MKSNVVTVSTSALPAASYTKPFSDISKIEDINRRELKVAKGKELATRANLVQGKVHKSNNRYENKKLDYKSKFNNPIFKKKRYCLVCGKPGHDAPHWRKRVINDIPPKPKVNLVERDDIIAAVISQTFFVANVQDWVVYSGATKHICTNRNVFTSYSTMGKGEEHVYLGDSRIASVLGKGRVLLKLTSGSKILALNEVLHVPNIRANLISVVLLEKAGIKVSFGSDKIIPTKNDIFIRKYYCNQRLFVLNISVITNKNASSCAFLFDSFNL
ncbi:uncharacterized protein LOC122722090 [Manihot esculenta]|uniref:uncharacterized protein LOC122722090 n=1 Tax=Manihot esculenta TaxID=3983 RepID=UPI001CC3D837|nr:uncharacterized protein LOC122722090 [Manihot esculenta]